MQTRRAITHQDALNLADWLTGLPVPFTLTMKEGDKRSLDQNALVHKWFGEIAKQRGDISAKDVKGLCHVTYGVPIRMRDPVWSRVWHKMFAPLTWEQQCFLFSQGILSMTRDMTTTELREYMDAMSADYRAQGVVLTDPEVRQ